MTIRGLVRSVSESRAVIVLLAVQAGLLAYSATRHSPTFLEPAFLASGLSHWQFGRFELYRVNPPLVRMVAAIPVIAVGCETDWSRFYDGPGSRAEFPAGEDFIKANGPASIPLFFYARWACIPLALIGGYFAYRWARDLYGPAAGLFTLLLWTFEPNLLAHAELITPDSACTSFGIAAGYWFWKWLKQPTWSHVGLAGLFLGLTQLSKMSWLMLFGLWPLLWLVWRMSSPEPRDQSPEPSAQNFEPSAECQVRSVNCLNSQPSAINHQPPLSQLAAILALALYLLNAGYAFDGTFTPLKEFTFVSTSLNGLEKPGTPGNRFRETLAGELPLPLPKQFVLGFDSQKKDFEKFGQPSYLRGEWKQGGWWYYYLYGLLVKVPCGTWGIFALVILTRLCTRHRPVPLRDELVLLCPAIALFALVSSQMEFNIHLRYVFPSLGLTLIWLGQAVSPFSSEVALAGVYRSCPTFSLARRCSIANFMAIGLAVYSLIGVLLVYPHHLAYFNDFIGGPRNGWKHILGSSFDWGQDWASVARWVEERRSENDLASVRVLARLGASYDPVAICPALRSNAVPQTADVIFYIESLSARLNAANAPTEALRPGQRCRTSRVGVYLVAEDRRLRVGVDETFNTVRLRSE